MSRAMMSGPDPGALPMISRIGFVGKGSAAVTVDVVRRLHEGGLRLAVAGQEQVRLTAIAARHLLDP